MSNEHSLMWSEASRNVEFEERNLLLAKARVALSDSWGFLSQASSTNEYRDRLALMDEQVSTTLSAVTGREDVHAEVLSSMESDFAKILEARTKVAAAAAADQAFGPEDYPLVMVDSADGDVPVIAETSRGVIGDPVSMWRPATDDEYRRYQNYYRNHDARRSSKTAATYWIYEIQAQVESGQQSRNIDGIDVDLSTAKSILSAWESNRGISQIPFAAVFDHAVGAIFASRKEGSRKTAAVPALPLLRGFTHDGVSYTRHGYLDTASSEEYWSNDGEWARITEDEYNRALTSARADGNDPYGKPFRPHGSRDASLRVRPATPVEARRYMAGKHVPGALLRQGKVMVREGSTRTAKEHPPYKITEDDGKFYVVNSLGEKKNSEGYSTRDEARELQKALYANTKTSTRKTSGGGEAWQQAQEGGDISQVEFALSMWGAPEDQIESLTQKFLSQWDGSGDAGEAAQSWYESRTASRKKTSMFLSPGEKVLIDTRAGSGKEIIVFWLGGSRYQVALPPHPGGERIDFEGEVPWTLDGATIEAKRWVRENAKHYVDGYTSSRRKTSAHDWEIRAWLNESEWSDDEITDLVQIINDLGTDDEDAWVKAVQEYQGHGVDTTASRNKTSNLEWEEDAWGAINEQSKGSGREVDCMYCNGTGKVGRRDCDRCGGTGMISLGRKATRKAPTPTDLAAKITVDKNDEAVLAAFTALRSMASRVGGVDGNAIVAHLLRVGSMDEHTRRQMKALLASSSKGK